MNFRTITDMDQLLYKIISLFLRKVKNKIVKWSRSCIYLLLPFRYGLNNKEQRVEKIIVSFTSYPKRFEYVPIVFKSICWQSMKPDKIILYLCQDECSGNIPEHIKTLSRYGLKIVFVEDNLKPHTKYFYSMQEYPNDIIITIDDDILYPKNMIQRLHNSYLKYPDCISAARVHQIKKDEKGRILRYNDWNLEYKKYKIPSHGLFATGVGGCLYPPHSLPAAAFDKENIYRLCLNADDVWLKFMELLNHKQVVYVPNANDCICVVKNSQIGGLCEKNLSEGENDIYIKNVMEYYQISDAEI